MVGRSSFGWVGPLQGDRKHEWMVFVLRCVRVYLCVRSERTRQREIKLKRKKKKKKGKLIMDENQKQKRQRRVEAEVEFELMQQGSYGGTNAHTQIHTATHSYKDCNERMTVGTNVARN